MALDLGFAPGQPTPWDPQPPILSAPLVDPNPPCMTTEEVARLSRQFYDDSAAMQRLWFLCQDVLDGFRNYMNADAQVRTGMEMQYFNRARDVSFNITQPTYRNISARLKLAMPRWGSRASSYSSGSLAAAAADAQMLEYHWKAAELAYVNQEAVNSLITYGTAATLTEMNGDNVVQSEFSPFRIRAEPGIADPDKCRFLGVSRITTKGALAKRFPDKADIINQCSPPKQQTSWWGTVGVMAQDRVEVLEVYLRSGHAYLLCGDGGAVLWEGTTPHGCMPVQIMYYTKVPHAFWGMGMVEQAMPAQYAFTQSWNQIIANARLMSNPKILIHENSGIKPDAFSSRAGEKITYRNQPPSAWTGSPMPQYAQQLPASAQSTLSDLTGIHSASIGKKSNLTTGRAIESMIGADDVQFEHTKNYIHKAIERHGRTALLYMQAYYDEAKVIRQFDRYGSAIYAELRASQLSADPQVFIEADTLFSDDIETVRQQIMSLAQQGAIPPDMMIKMLQNNINPLRAQKPIADYVDAKKALDLVVAQGFQVMNPATGVPRKTVKFYPTDNMAVFADVVKQFIRSDEFDALDEARKDDIDLYYRDILELMQPQQAGPPPGAPGSGSAPPAKMSGVPGSPVGAAPAGSYGNAGNARPTSDQEAVARQTAEAESAGG